MEISGHTQLYLLLSTVSTGTLPKSRTNTYSRWPANMMLVTGNVDFCRNLWPLNDHKEDWQWQRHKSISAIRPGLAQRPCTSSKPSWTRPQTLREARFTKSAILRRAEPRKPKTSVFRTGDVSWINPQFCDILNNLCRYFGNNYPRLLKIKRYWDPENIINHCHSVGSTEQECCVEGAWSIGTCY